MGFLASVTARNRVAAFADAAVRLGVGVPVLALPWALLHARAAAEMLIAATDVLFLLRAWAVSDWAWSRRAFSVAAGLWWAWLVVCSIRGGGLAHAVVAIRLPLYAVALGEWALVAGQRRRLLLVSLQAAAAWIALEVWQQYIFGTNIFGQGRWADGALTGPFAKPRAGPAYIIILFPAVLPAVTWLLARRRRAAAAAAAVLAVLTMVLIGQRMPTVLMLLGLVLAGLFLPGLRLVLAAGAATGALLLTAAPLVAPGTYAKLVLNFADQLRNFAQSPYGQIYARAIGLAMNHPWMGQGFDAFRRGCGEAVNMRALPWLGVTAGDARAAGLACNIHPHNYYLEAADDGGLPLVLLFALLAGVMLWRLFPGRGGPALRTGLFVGAVLAFWPVASTSAFAALPNAGWIFLLVGWGFAEGRDKIGGIASPRTPAS